MNTTWEATLPEADTVSTAAIVREKTEQAVGILAEQGVDLWVTFVRETSHVKDPVLDLILGFDLTWISALMIHRSGRRIALVGRYDVDNVEGSGAYDDVIGYDQDFQPALVETLVALDPQRIALNYSEDDPASDGLTYGMYRLLNRALTDTPYASRLGPAAHIIAALRGRKVPAEVALIRDAVHRTEEAIAEVHTRLRPGIKDTDVADFLHSFVDDHGYGTAWEREYCPVVTVGPESTFGHGMPKGLRAEPGNLVHIDFGISHRGFVSDLQRTWYLAGASEAEVPKDVQDAWQAVTQALEAGRAALVPGVRGRDVDAVARETLVDAGYPEFMHAFGHQVGRTAHDGATLLGPPWARYGSSVDGIIEAGNVFAIELGVAVPGRGYVSREENVVVTEEGAIYLSHPQDDIWVV